MERKARYIGSYQVVEHGHFRGVELEYEYRGRRYTVWKPCCANYGTSLAQQHRTEQERIDRLNEERTENDVEAAPSNEVDEAFEMFWDYVNGEADI